MRHIAIRVPTIILEELRRRATENERSLSGEIRLALKEHLKLAASRSGGKRKGDDSKRKDIYEIEKQQRRAAD
jgi:hypothetical protein